MIEDGPTAALPERMSVLGRLMAAGIRAWVRMTGRRVARLEAPWLQCPMGRSERIGSEFYAQLAADEDLTIRRDEESGLLTSFSALDGSTFSAERVDPRVRDFYESTSAYRMEAWSEASMPPRLFVWLITRFVSRPMDQLNVPVSSLELAGGMTSDVLPMFNGSGQRVYTGWSRRLPALNRVIYTGLYSVERPGASADPCVKVTFPVPRGSATVFLRPMAAEDGALLLVSDGTRFGESGFYRMVELSEDFWKVRYIKTLREQFRVYVDPAGALRCDHLIYFLGMKVLHLHYRMDRVRPKLIDSVPSIGT